MAEKNGLLKFLPAAYKYTVGSKDGPSSIPVNVTIGIDPDFKKTLFIAGASIGAGIGLGIVLSSVLINKK
jgi:hypothetical protein